MSESAVVTDGGDGRALDGEILDPVGTMLWPSTLALECAMALSPPKDICKAYGIDREKWNRIRQHPVFIAEVTASIEALRQEGAAFKARAQLQALELLKDNWRMIHDVSFPPAVRANLLMFTIRAAGLDASKDQGIASGKGGVGGGLAINIFV